VAHGQALPDPLEAVIRARNAKRIARRASISSLVSSLTRSTGFQSLTRGGNRQVGQIRISGIEKIPERKHVPQPQAFGTEDFQKFINAFMFKASRQIVPRRDFVVGATTSRRAVGFSSGILPVGLRL